MYNLQKITHDDKIFFVKFSNTDERLVFGKSSKKLLKNCDGKHFYNLQKIIHDDKISFVEFPNTEKLVFGKSPTNYSKIVMENICIIYEKLFMVTKISLWNFQTLMKN